jgi:hypothetical protein
MTTADKDAADEFLAPVVAGTAAYGAKKRLAEKLSERTGEAFSRHVIERWLHKDPSKRRQPLLGVGLLIREVFEHHNRKTAKAKLTPYASALVDNKHNKK